MEALFDKIHGDTYRCNRTEPVSVEEFVEFGLQPEDYVYYIGLQQRLQSELLLHGAVTANYPELKELISFCQDKRLMARADDFQPSSFYAMRANELQEVKLHRWDAEYYHEWLRYPKESAEFRLTVERKLTLDWDEEDAYITKTYGGISFHYDAYTEVADGVQWIEFDSPVRIMNYDSESKKLVTLRNIEAQKLYEIARKEKHEIEKEIAHHLTQMPSEQDVVAVSNGLPWVKKMYVLSERQEIIENVFERMREAANTPDVYKFEASDMLFVFCGSDVCRENGHLLSNDRVEFSYYGKPNKQYTIRRCAHCRRYQISLQELIEMIDSYGIPNAKIVYDDDDENIDFPDFPETSIFHNIGYTTSQSAGMTAARRQSILKHAIDTGKASQNEVLKFLKRRIDINGMKAGNEIALRKWKEDYEYIRNL